MENDVSSPSPPPHDEDVDDGFVDLLAFSCVISDSSSMKSIDDLMKSLASIHFDEKNDEKEKEHIMTSILYGNGLAAFLNGPEEAGIFSPDPVSDYRVGVKAFQLSCIVSLEHLADETSIRIFKAAFTPAIKERIKWIVEQPWYAKWRSIDIMYTVWKHIRSSSTTTPFEENEMGIFDDFARYGRLAMFLNAPFTSEESREFERVSCVDYNTLPRYVLPGGIWEGWIVKHRKTKCVFFIFDIALISQNLNINTQNRLRWLFSRSWFITRMRETK